MKIDELREQGMQDMRELAGLPRRDLVENVTVDQIGEQAETESVIKALADTDYRDKDAYFKMVQLLKGLAVASEEDKLADKFMSTVSDAMTDAVKKVLSDK